MNFDSIEKRLTQTYAQKRKGSVTYFLKEGNVVAREENDCIVMYFRCKSNVIWNHYGIVAMAVAKDFQLVKKNDDQYQITLADVIVVTGLCGACNAIRKVSNRLLKVTYIHEIEYQEESYTGELKIGTIGIVKERGVFEFDDLEMKIEIPKDMCEYDFYALNYSILKCKNNRRRKRKPKCIQNKDYEVADVLREEWDWFWNAGFHTAGSRKTRSMIEHTKRANYHKLAKATVTILQN